MPGWRNMLQRRVLRKRPILCQWAVPGLEVQPVEAADLVGRWNSNGLPSGPRCCPPTRGQRNLT
jgi:hypothetical protein